jgi:peptidoglycan/LPS O-acetylase OafA/YrhL
VKTSGRESESLNQAEEGKAKGVPLFPLDPSGRIPELDGLRGLAILLVIICHYIGEAEHAQLSFPLRYAFSALSVGWSGVDLFFVLSGFLIGGILVDAREAPNYFRTFYLRRVYRIFPIYYVWIFLYGALICGALWLLPGRYPVSLRDLAHVPYQLFFLQNIVYGFTPFAWKWFSVTWSLAVEEQFYLLAPPVIRFLTVRKVVFVLVAAIGFAPLLRLFVLLHYGVVGSYVVACAMPCRVDTLAIGVLTAIAWRTEDFRGLLEKHGLLLSRVLMVLFLGVLGLWWWLAHPVGVVTVAIGYTWLAVFYACMLLVALSQTRGRLAGVMRWRVLRSLGTISYCGYLIHSTIHHLAFGMLLHAQPEIYNPKGVGVTLFSLVLTMAVASLSWRYFEKPLIRRGHSYSYWREVAAIERQPSLRAAQREI